MTTSDDAVFSLNRREFMIGTVLAGSAGLRAVATDKSPSATFMPGSDWPMYRHDSAMSAESPIRGDFAKPPIVDWTIDLGGPGVPQESILVRDVTGDGIDKFLALRSDSVTCRDNRGQQLWKLDDFLNPTIVEILDFAGDGSRGILATTTRAGRIDTFMIHGRTGQATRLWYSENNFGGHTRMGKLLSGVEGMQIVATTSGQTPPAPHGGDVYLVSFEAGLDRPRFRVREHVTGVFYSPLILVADLDGDGQDEIVVVGHEQIWAFETQTGKQTFYSTYGPSIRTYMATITAVKLQAKDACPALIMTNPSLPGLKAVAHDGRTFSRELWKVVIGGSEDQYQKLVTIAPAGTSLVYDLNNDGHFLALTSIKNEHGDGETHLVIFDTRNGERVQELPAAEVLAADDLDGDGKQELLIRRGPQLQIARWQQGRLDVVWQQVNVIPLLRPLPREGDLRLYSGSSPIAKGNSTVWSETAGSADFLFGFPDGVHSCRLEVNELKKGKAVAQHEALGNGPSRPVRSEKIVWDGTTLITMVDGREVYRYLPPAPTTYLAPPPLVADLSGKRRILVRNSAGKFLSYAADGQVERTFVERPFETAEVHVDPVGMGPLVCDVDGDGENEVVMTLTDANARPICAILDGNGVEKGRIELLPGMTTMNRGPTGRLGPGRGRWIVLRMSGEGPNHERRFVVAAYDGQTRNLLWTRDHYGHYGAKPVVFAAHLPGAVVDYDGDGADDWLVCSENFYGIITVKDNKDLVGPVVLSDAVPGHWTAYSYPSVASLNADSKPLVFHHSAFSLVLVTDLEGKPVWHYGMTRDTAGRWGQFADVDGDGRREILHSQPDGVLRCFIPEETSQCPTCPADSTRVSARRNEERWHIDLGRPISRMIAADVDGDGRQELLFGGDDGFLHALGERDGKPRLLWSVPLGRRVGEPILVELDGVGGPRILVAVEDGKLYCLKSK